MTYAFEEGLEDVWREDELDEDERDDHADQHDPRALQDAHVAQTVADRALRRHFRWASGLGWMQYRRGRWVDTSEARVVDRVRRDLIDQHAKEARDGADADRLKGLSGLLSAPRIRALVTLAKGILEADSGDFDQHPDLLNVGNGVVNLITGDLLPHDPELLLTKITNVAYDAAATSADWEAALDALPEPVVDWLQVRVGQAASGHPTPDDIMPVLQGGGSNGKTTITGTLTRALGHHAVTVPERVLMANPSDHPTELMTLRGARFAIIEETPEARHLNVKRLKDVLGTPTMTARLIARNNVTWDATHSLFLTTNYKPRVDETDHGTWRRLALVRFPYTFTDPDEPLTSSHARHGLPGLRERLRDGREGQHEAVLAWVVAGARSWYEGNRLMPPAPAIVKADTSEWRAEADLICGYIDDRLKFDSARHIATTDMYEDFTGWITTRGHKAWGDQLLSARFSGNPRVEDAKVTKSRTRGPLGLSRSGLSFTQLPAQYNAWHGVRFRIVTDEDDEKAQAADQQERGTVQGVQGYSDGSHTKGHIETTRQPLHSLHTDSSPTTINDLMSTAPPIVCAVCHLPMNPVLAAIGDTTHPACEQT